VTSLPGNFHFSQASLQDYVECRRRFQLRYLENLAWPAVEAEPALENERRLQLGADFHRLVQQHLLGLPAEKLSRMVASRGPGGKELPRWWDSYLHQGAGLAGYMDIPGLSLHPEISLTAPLSKDYRLVAKYDLVAAAPDGRAAIFDWKTFRRRPKRQQMAQRLQTRVYPYLLVLAGAHLNQGIPFQPDQVEMVYWYPEFAAEPERFPYSQAQFDADGSDLQSLVDEIESLNDDEFYLTDHVERCRFCTYRSLCDRGVKAGGLDEIEVREEAEALSTDFEISFDQIAEIEF
jgi:hypothetical protein